MEFPASLFPQAGSGAGEGYKALKFHPSGFKDNRASYN